MKDFGLLRTALLAVAAMALTGVALPAAAQLGDLQPLIDATTSPSDISDGYTMVIEPTGGQLDPASGVVYVPNAANDFVEFKVSVRRTALDDPSADNLGNVTVDPQSGVSLQLFNSSTALAQDPTNLPTSGSSLCTSTQGPAQFGACFYQTGSSTHDAGVFTIQVPVSAFGDPAEPFGAWAFISVEDPEFGPITDPTGQTYGAASGYFNVAKTTLPAYLADKLDYTITPMVLTAGAAAPESPVNAPPTAVIVAPNEATVGKPAAFSGSGSSDPEGEAITCAFDFGDGSTVVDGQDCESEVVHIYDTAGDYTAIVTVSDGQDSDAADAAVPVSFAQPAVSCADNPVMATLSITDNEAPDDGQGQAPLTVNFAVLDVTGGDGSYSYTFNFGDGTGTGTTQTSTADRTYDYAGSFDARAIVTDSNGCYWDETRTISVFSDITVSSATEVTADLLASSYGGAIPLTVTFDASNSSAPTGRSVTKYEYDFEGDGTFVEGASVVRHVYTQPGTFTVTVRVTGTDDADATDVVTDEATVDIGVSSNQQTTAQLTVDPTTGRAKATSFTFDGQHSIAAEGETIVSYTFDFGDGSDPEVITVGSGFDAATQANASHVYDAAGSYSPSLTVATSASTKTISRAYGKVRVLEPVTGGGDTSGDVTGDTTGESRSGGGGSPGWLMLSLASLLVARRRRRT